MSGRDVFGLLTEANWRAAAGGRGGRWPGLGPEDSEIWEAWLARCPLSGVEWRYGVRLGWATRLSSEELLGGVVAYVGLLAKRVDVVGRQGDVWWAVEVKPVGGMSALGQAVTYAELLAGEVGELGEVRPAIVCWRADPDVVGVCGRLGVWLWEVGGPEPVGDGPRLVVRGG